MVPNDLQLKLSPKEMIKYVTMSLYMITPKVWNEQYEIDDLKTITELPFIRKLSISSVRFIFKVSIFFIFLKYGDVFCLCIWPKFFFSFLKSIWPNFLTILSYYYYCMIFYSLVSCDSKYEEVLCRTICFLFLLYQIILPLILDSIWRFFFLSYIFQKQKMVQRVSEFKVK